MAYVLSLPWSLLTEFTKVSWLVSNILSLTTTYTTNNELAYYYAGIASTHSRATSAIQLKTGLQEKQDLLPLTVMASLILKESSENA